jgi:hypothetical protein
VGLNHQSSLFHLIYDELNGGRIFRTVVNTGLSGLPAPPSEESISEECTTLRLGTFERRTKREVSLDSKFGCKIRFRGETGRESASSDNGRSQGVLRW